MLHIVMKNERADIIIDRQFTVSVPHFTPVAA